MGVRRAVPDAECVLRPIADGGDGSLDAFTASGFARRPVTTRGPTGVPVDASYATDGSTAVVELASTCGLVLLPGGVPAPMTSTTEGLGDAIRAALDERPSRIIVCIGGSASTDGGTGLLVALGARLLDADGAPVPPGGAWLARIADLDLSLLDPRLHDTDITIAADVTSPLHGPEGAATVFAPQKGATRDEVAAARRGTALVGRRAGARHRSRRRRHSRRGCCRRRRRGPARRLRRDDRAGCGTHRGPRRPRRCHRRRRPRHHRRGQARRAERARQGSRRRLACAPVRGGCLRSPCAASSTWTRPTCVRPASTAGATACRVPRTLRTR